MSEEVKKAVLDFFKSKEKTKTKFYMNDLRKVAPEGMSNREFKKVDFPALINPTMATRIGS